MDETSPETAEKEPAPVASVQDAVSEAILKEEAEKPEETAKAEGTGEPENTGEKKPEERDGKDDTASKTGKKRKFWEKKK